MIPELRKAINAVVCILGALVISLSASVYAATAPVVTILDPLVDPSILSPKRMALDSNGDIYVADQKAGGILRLNQFGEFVQKISTKLPTAHFALLPPKTTGAANINNTGGKLLVGQKTYVAILDQAGVEVGKLMMNATTPYSFSDVGGMTVDQATGDIYVINIRVYTGQTAFTGNSQVIKFNNAGVKVAVPTTSGAFGTYGYSTGQFMQPMSVSVVGGQLAVLDATRGNVQFYDKATGVYKSVVGIGTALSSSTTNVTAGPLYFSYPTGLAFDYVNGVASRMYILDMYQGQAHVADMATKAFLRYVSSPAGDKRVGLLAPTDMVYDDYNKRLLLSNGNSNIISFGIDGGNNPTKIKTFSFTVDQSEITVSTPNVNLSGSVDAGCVVESSVNTTATFSGPVSIASGKWTLSVNNLVPGRNDVSLKAYVFKDGRVFSESIVRPVIVNYVQTPVSLAIDSFTSPTKFSSLHLSGTTDEGASVAVEAGTITKSATVTGTTWYADLDILAEGSNSIKVTATQDEKGAATRNLTVFVDSQAPILTISSLNNATTANQIQNISGTINESTQPQLTINGENVALLYNAQDKIYSFSTAINLNKGANTIEIIATDVVGNSSSVSRTITFNPALPIITVVSPTDNSITNIKNIAISGVLNVPVKSLVVAGVPVIVNGLEWSSTLALAPNMNNVLIKATDEFDQNSSKSLTIYYDSESPKLAIVNPPADLATNQPNMVAEVTLSDDSGSTPESLISATLTSSDFSADLTQPVINGCDATKCNLSLVFPAKTAVDSAEPDKDVTYSLTVTAKDKAGNVSTAVRTFIYDTASPVFTVDKTADPYPSSLSGTIEKNSTIAVKTLIASTDGSSVLTSFGKDKVVVTDEKWTADLSGLEYDYKNLTVEAVDAAGNTSQYKVNLPDPDGDTDADGTVTIMDAISVIKLVVSHETPTNDQLTHADIGPLVNGKASRNGKLEIDDAILILKKSLGIINW